MMSARPVDVAVGVVIRADGAVLLGQRPPGKPYAGWWEFPGGKLERGESVADALVRELDEELGLRVRGSCPWVVRRFVYPHATVLLHFRRVFDFEGTPHSREGQAFAWRMPGAIDVAPLLPATVPVIAWLRLPAVSIRSAAAELGDDAFVKALERRLHDHRVAQLLLDEPALAPARFEALFYRVMALCRAHRVPVLVGSRHPESFWRAAGGVLLAPDDLMRVAARPALPTVAAGISEPAALGRAEALGLDFVVASPAEPGAGAAGLSALLAETGLPAYADAGWAVSAGDALRAGAHGVAHPAQFWQDH